MNRRDREAGMTTIQYVAATAMSLVVFVGMANFIVDLYARGVVRSALDEGARAGAPVDVSPTECEQGARRAREPARRRDGPIGPGVVP